MGQRAIRGDHRVSQQSCTLPIPDGSPADDGLRALPYTTNRVASLGWCFGGGQSLQLSLSDAELNATVIYYGSLVTDAETSISVETVETFDRTLGELGVEREIYVYKGAPHAFANPSGERFHPEATQDAWARTLTFLDAHLRG